MTGLTRGMRSRRALMLSIIAGIAVLAVFAVSTRNAAPDEAAGGSGEVASAAAPPFAVDTTDSKGQLDTLTVLAERPDVPGYQRGCAAGQRCSFGPAWTDDSAAPDGHNGCGTRNDVLREQLTGVVLADGSRCAVVAGTLQDPYTGNTIAFRKADAAAVQIDHVYALARAFDMGAARWTQQQRTAFANDTELELLAVDGAVNQAKGDAGPAEWMPPDPVGACGYVQRYIAIAARYRLAITAAEHGSMANILTGCG